MALLFLIVALLFGFGFGGTTTHAQGHAAPPLPAAAHAFKKNGCVRGTLKSARGGCAARLLPSRVP